MAAEGQASPVCQFERQHLTYQGVEQRVRQHLTPWCEGPTSYLGRSGPFASPRARDEPSTTSRNPLYATLSTEQAPTLAWVGACLMSS